MTDQSSNIQTSIRKIWQLLTSRERKGTVILFVLTFIGMGLETLGVGLVIPALAILTQADYAEKISSIQPVVRALGHPTQETLVILGMIVLVTIYAIKALFLGFLAWRQNCFAFGVQAQLSLRLFTVYLSQPYTFHLQRNSAQLITNTINEVAMFGGIVTKTMSIFSECLVLLGISVLLLAAEPLGAVIVVSVLGFAGLGFHQLTRARFLRWGEARQYHERLRLQHLQQGLGAAKDIKLLGRESEFLEKYSIHNTQNARVGQLEQTLAALPRLWLELLAVGGLAALVFTMLAQGRELATILPTLGLFAAAAFRVLPSVNRILGAAQTFKYGLPVIDVLHAELRLPTMTAETRNSLKLPFERTLELNHVVFTYPGASNQSLKDISLTIASGESVGFIGASGAGKSTLVDVVLGLLTPDTGQVCVDGHDVQSNLRHWQDQIGYVPQTIFLTDDTLRRNIAFGISDAQIDENSIRRAICAAQLDDYVNGLPDGLDSVVGERGVRLSGGQRQRIGIARALYHDPAVLVLDEATSALDTETERGVIEAVRALQGTKTVIIVAHRLSTVKYCGRIYKLENGQVIGE